MADLVIGFDPNWYEGQLNAGLGFYISPGSINGKVYPGQVFTVPPNATTYIWITGEGETFSGITVPAGVYPIAQVVSGIITTGTGVNRYAPQITQAPGILS